MRFTKSSLKQIAASEGERLKHENIRMRALLNDRDYIQCKADYNRGHLSHANYLESKERGLELAHEQAAPVKEG